MPLVPPEYLFLWLLALFAGSYVLFRKRALVYWSFLAPIILAIKLGISDLMIGAGIGSALAAFLAVALFKPGGVTVDMPAEVARNKGVKAVQYEWKLQPLLALALAIALTLAFALALDAVVGIEARLKQTGLNEKTATGITVGFFCFVALMISCCFIRSRRIPLDKVP